jgi:hypothetical protein
MFPAPCTAVRRLARPFGDGGARHGAPSLVTEGSGNTRGRALCRKNDTDESMIAARRCSVIDLHREGFCNVTGGGGGPVAQLMGTE